MKNVWQLAVGVVAIGVVSLATAGEAKALNPNNWGPFSASTSNPESAFNTNNGDTVTIQVTVFNNSSWATVSGTPIGSYINSQELKCTTGNQGSDQLNANIIFICLNSGTTLEADALAANGRTGLEAL
jgi:hypothetical protein